jgi:hypothetical protein
LAAKDRNILDITAFRGVLVVARRVSCGWQRSTSVRAANLQRSDSIV